MTKQQPDSQERVSPSPSSPVKKVADVLYDATIKEDSDSWYARNVRNPIIKFISHPLTTLALRVVAVATTVSVPVLAGALVAAQASCISLDVARKYRSSRLKERAGLMDKYEALAKKREDAVKALIAKDPSKKEELEKRFLSKPENQEYEKLPRKDTKSSRYQFLASAGFEAGFSAVSDILSTYGAIVAVKVVFDLIPTAFGLCAKDKKSSIGSYTKRKEEIEENDRLRGELIQRAKKVGMPSYERSTVKFTEHMRELSKDVKVLEALAAQGRGYSNAEFDMYRKDVKAEDFRPRSKFAAGLKCLRESVFGSKEDYSFLFGSKHSTPTSAPAAGSHAAPALGRVSSSHSVGEDPAGFQSSPRNSRAGSNPDEVAALLSRGATTAKDPQESETPTRKESKTSTRTRPRSHTI